MKKKSAWDRHLARVQRHRERVAKDSPADGFLLTLVVVFGLTELARQGLLLLDWDISGEGRKVGKRLDTSGLGRSQCDLEGVAQILYQALGGELRLSERGVEVVNDFDATRPAKSIVDVLLTLIKLIVASLNPAGPKEGLPS